VCQLEVKTTFNRVNNALVIMSMLLFDPSLPTDEIVAERTPIAAIQIQAFR
jgi:hypothetical protein